MVSNPDISGIGGSIDTQKDGGGVVEKEINWYRQLWNAVMTGDRKKSPSESRKEIADNINRWKRETPLRLAELFNRNLPFRDAFWQRFDWTHEKFWVNEAMNPPKK